MHFEQFAAGQSFTSPARIITHQDLDAFVALSGLDLPMFMDDDGARSAGHSRRLVPAPLQLSLAMGLAKRTGVFDHVLAVAGFDDMRFLRPVHPGDSMVVDIKVTQTRRSHRPDAGLVVLEYSATVDGEPVMQAVGAYLMRVAGL